jgi:pyruvate dehydrogenase E2 component (dihydrolipoamide acetyltransferase)
METIKFVDVGEGITEGHVRKWLVKDGDQVKEDQPVVQVETDKAVVNVPAPIGGTIKESAPENSDVHIGDVIAYIGTASELQAALQQAQAPKQAAVQQQTSKQSAPAAASPTEAKEILATPAVRKLARDLGVDISKLTPTGPHGRLTENDVRGVAHEESLKSRPIPKYSEVLEEQHKEDVERIPMSPLRKAIAKNMEASWTIPRAVHMDLIDATALYGVVQREKEKALKQLNVKLTFLPFIIKATVQALKEYPNFNASYDHEKLEIIRKNYYNIGLAAESPDGLLVVVVKEADRKSITEIAKELQDLHERVEKREVTLEEMRDSTFTITNIGSLGGGFLSVPMINYPDVAILGIHMIKDTPMVRDGKIVIGKELPFSISFDHRVVDGAEAVHFGNALKKYLEDPDFLEMMG